MKGDVKIEPLVCRWYAWSHLVSPAQLALHLTYRILPLMQSFATHPSVHIAANRDPEMYGGPFVSLNESDVGRIKSLIKETQLECADLVQFAQDLRALDTRLQNQASGYSLNEFYDGLPESLQGLVELVYDTHNRPTVLTFEALLYEADMASHKQEILLQKVAERERHFFMSTPRVETSDSLSFKMKFSDKRLDILTAMRSKPGSFEEVAGLLEVNDESKQAFRQFFDTRIPPRRGVQNYIENGIRMRYFGHACVLFQTAEISVLFDPFVSIENGNDDRFTLNDLPDTIDYVVITHSHQDHFSPEMLLQLRHRIKRVIVPVNNSGNIADPSMKLMLKSLGFNNVEVLDCFDQTTLPGGYVQSLPFTGEHADLNIRSKHAIMLAMQGKKFMFLVDSDGRDVVLYQRMMRKVGHVDVLFIGMECHGAPLNWLYEPLLGNPVNRRNNESRRLSGANCERASNVLVEIKPQRVFVYAMGQEPWMQYIMGLQYQPDNIQLIESDKFVAHCINQGIQAERLYLHREITF
nr:MBL fold metallo-hydrolase [Collimonas pratensis]